MSPNNGDCCKCPPSTPTEEKAPDTSCSAPEVMVCYKIPKCAKSCIEKEKSKRKDEEIKLKASKSRELRAGILYIGCDCEKRNGLQDDCQRSECQGSPPCLTMPKPTCGPSQFSNGKHLIEKTRLRQAKKDLQTVDGVPNSNNAKSNELFEEYVCYPAVIDTTRPPCAC